MCCEQVKGQRFLEFDLTVVCDACAAEIKLHKLIAADQTSLHYGVSHLRAGQPQHLENTH